LICMGLYDSDKTALNCFELIIMITYLSSKLVPTSKS
jgi:hypothetical protein